MSKYAIVIASALSALTMVSDMCVANAATIDFDCDVPPNHFSSVSQETTGPLGISGLIELKEMRSGENLPLAGARLVSADGTLSTGFRLMAASPRAKQLDIKLNTKRGEVINEVVLGQVDAKASVPFNFSLSEAGKVVLTIGGSTFGADFIPIVNGKEMAFCSTAQFKFTKLLFSGAAPASSFVR